MKQRFLKHFTEKAPEVITSNSCGSGGLAKFIKKTTRIGNKVKFLLIVIALFAAMPADLFSQEKGKFRGGVDFGIFPLIGGSYDSFDPYNLQINFGYNLQDNVNIGIKVGSYNVFDWDIFNIFAGTYTYYFDTKVYPFTPFVGGGIGLYSVDYEVYDERYNRAERVYDKQTKIGCFLTCGFEFSKFRVTAECNLIPVTQISYYIYDSNSRQNQLQSVEKNKNSYLAINAGFYFGGGKRKTIDNSHKF